jgi:hypothetical protein
MVGGRPLIKMREEDIVSPGRSFQLSRYSCESFKSERAVSKIVGMAGKVDVRQNSPLKWAASLQSLPQQSPIISLGSNSGSCTMGKQQQCNSSGNPSVSEPGESRNIEVHLNYTADSTETSIDKPFLPRVPAIPKNLNYLAFQCSRDNEQTRPNCPRPIRYTPRRRSTFELFEITADCETAAMSSEKAINPKDKLEGMYQGRA